MKGIVKCILIVFIVLSSAQVFAACTDVVTIKRLSPREGGWLHIEANGVNDLDIKNCGSNYAAGMLLNFNDSHGSQMGKKILLTSLMTALHTGATLILCSDACDSQHPAYSELSYIDWLEH